MAVGQFSTAEWQRLRWWPKTQQPIPGELRYDLQRLLDAYEQSEALLTQAEEKIDQLRARRA